LSDPDNRAGVLTVSFLSGYIDLSVPAVGLGVLTQDVAGKTALLIFGAVLVAGVDGGAGFLLRRPEAPVSSRRWGPRASGSAGRRVRG
jgi:hypothetical protein